VVVGTTHIPAPVELVIRQTRSLAQGWFREQEAPRVPATGVVVTGGVVVGHPDVVGFAAHHSSIDRPALHASPG
jgi:hypothetical protein